MLALPSGQTYGFQINEGIKMIFKIILILISFMRPVPLSAIEPVKKIEMEVTAYCGCEKCCGTHSPGITASGYKIRQGDKLIAAPEAFLFGTRMYIPGYGHSSIKDRGGSIKGNRLDVYFSTHEEALQWGRRKLLVIVFPGG